MRTHQDSTGSGRVLFLRKKTEHYPKVDKYSLSNYNVKNTLPRKQIKRPGGTKKKDLEP